MRADQVEYVTEAGPFTAAEYEMVRRRPSTLPVVRPLRVGPVEEEYRRAVEERAAEITRRLLRGRKR